jgi:hypothetical protein
MRTVPLDLGLGSNPAEDSHAGACRHINCQVEPLGDGAKGPMTIRAVDGFSDFTTLQADTAIRAMLALTDSEAYAVTGRVVYQFDQTGAKTAIGGCPSDGRVSMARNRRGTPQVAIVSDGLYFAISGGVLTQIQDVDLFPPISVCHLNGYFCFLSADGVHYASDIDDVNVTALSSGTAGSNPDAGVVNWVRGQDLCIGGTHSLEFWQDVGASPYPFQRTTAIDVGVLSAGSVASIGQTSAFVAHDGTVRRLSGYQAEVISTGEIERLIADDADPQSITATTWFYRGTTYYALSGTTWTRVYNTKTQRWHDRQSYGLDRWRAQHAVQFGQSVILGDYANGKLYTMSHTAYDEAGQPLVMSVQPPPVHADQRMKHTRMDVTFEAGVGRYAGSADSDLILTDDDDVTLLSDEDGETLLTDIVQVNDSSDLDPMLMMDYSDDGATNFGVQRMRSMGLEGQRLKQIAFTSLGSSRNRTYRLSMSAAVRRSISAARLTVS